MIISPDEYYEEYLKGKTSSEIITVIRGLKNKIGHLKNKMEHPNYCEQHIADSCEFIHLQCARLYLERAKEELKAASGTYTLSQEELKVAYFDESIPKINKLVFSIGGFFSGFETRTYTINDEHLYLDVKHSLKSELTNHNIEPDYPCCKEEFLDGLRKLHIGEWRSKYDLSRFGIMGFDDGTQWELEIYFSNGHKIVKAYGDNAYPYNFNLFKELLGVASDIEN